MNPTSLRAPRAFRCRTITVLGREYEIHPGRALRGRPTVYARTNAGLWRVRDLRLAAFIVREYQARARERWWQTAWRMLRRWLASRWARLRRWWARKRAERAARNAPIPPVEIRHVGELRNLAVPQSREVTARLVEIIRAEHARQDKEASHG